MLQTSEKRGYLRVQVCQSKDLKNKAVESNPNGIYLNTKQYGAF